MRIRIYTEPVNDWRGIFADHPWIALEREPDGVWVVIEIKDWMRNNHINYFTTNDPATCFEGNGEGKIYQEVRVPKELFTILLSTIYKYPWKNTYKSFPGPNSNTFVQWFIDQHPYLELKDLGLRSIGRHYHRRNEITGIQD